MLSHITLLISLFIACTLSQEQGDVNRGKLIITPLLRKGSLVEAREAAKVKDPLLLAPHVTSYSGFFDVETSCNAHLFFWFFPAEVESDTAPLILWHGGGPGSSGLAGLFVQNGPFIVNENGSLEARAKDASWTTTRSVLYFDSPVGTGLSTVDDRPECAVNSAMDTARQAYEGLTQFFQLFPEMNPLPFYIFTGSYGGKFGPAIAHEIHLHNIQGRNGVAPEVTINLKGLYVSSGFFDPLSQIDYSPFYNAMGLIDKEEQRHFALQEDLAKNCIREGNFTCAFDIIEPLIIGVDGQPSRLKNVTGLDFVYNALSNVNETPSFMKNHEAFLSRGDVQKALHVNSSGGTPYYTSSPEVYVNFKDDIYKSVKHLVEELLESGRGYKFVFSGGQLDLVVPHTTVVSFMDSLDWSLGSSWRTNTPTNMWKTDDDFVGGYLKTLGPLSYLFMRNTGHIWGFDQPQWAHQIMTRFTQGNDLHAPNRKKK